MIKIEVYYKIWVGIVLKKFKVNAYMIFFIKTFKCLRQIYFIIPGGVRLELETSKYKLPYPP